MVSVTEEQVYNALSYDWQEGRKVKERLNEQLGLNNLSVGQKISYLLGFQSWTVNGVEFYLRLAYLEKKGLVETDDRFEEFEGETLRTRYVRKKSGGSKEKETRDVQQGNLELGLPGNQTV
jgi:hypothetical protein